MEMGERLATEVKQYIISFCPASCLSKISFIGHSLGGIVIRASLPHLSEYSSKFFTYMSLSSPHIGQMYNKSSIVDIGLWALKKWKKSRALMQLSMTDESKMEDTCLYRLSEMPGFCWFKNIVFVGST
jgi:triacylglycerol esterase/lipase EstA (alpha/beta hydrolase family)